LPANEKRPFNASSRSPFFIENCSIEKASPRFVTVAGRKSFHEPSGDARAAPFKRTTITSGE